MGAVSAGVRRSDRTWHCDHNLPKKSPLKLLVNYSVPDNCEATGVRASKNEPEETSGSSNPST